MIERFFQKFIKNEKGEVNMIAIVLILIVVVVLAAVFKEGIKGVLDAVLDRIKNDVNNF